MRTDEVVVVGAGPAGLMLAGDLADAGVPVTVLEQRERGIRSLSRAIIVYSLTLEQFDARGMADDLVSKARPVSVEVIGRGQVVHRPNLPSRFTKPVNTPQYETERVLLERLERLGVEIVYEAEVLGVRQDSDGVELDVRIAGQDGVQRGAYAVGADGGNSVVRRSLGVDFPGQTLATALVADAILKSPPDVDSVVSSNGNWTSYVGAFADGYHRLVAFTPANPDERDKAADFDELREVMISVLGTDHGACEPRWLSRYQFDERLATEYRVGRVFLVGDAAHVHSPVGGQGMNTGLQDATNLGWKLAAVLRRQAPGHPAGHVSHGAAPVWRACARNLRGRAA